MLQKYKLNISVAVLGPELSEDQANGSFPFVQKNINHHFQNQDDYLNFQCRLLYHAIQQLLENYRGSMGELGVQVRKSSLEQSESSITFTREGLVDEPDSHWLPEL